MVKGKIRLHDVRALKPGEIIWDTAVVGFCARRQRSAAVVYFVVYRTRDAGRQRWHRIGRHGSPWTPDTARDEARQVLGHVVGGGDPAAEQRSKRKASTVADLCDLYITDVEKGRWLTRRRHAKRASTIATDRGRIERHIKPLLGALKVPAVTREDIEQFKNAVAEGKTAGKTKTAKKRGLARVKGGRGTANRTLGLLGGIFTYALHHRMRPDNPVRGVPKDADKAKDRRLSDDEYKALGTALGKAAAGDVWPPAVAATKFLAVTGWRSGEALALRWRDMDLGRHLATLPTTKTGRSLRPLSTAACDVLGTMTRTKNDALVFPATRGEGRMAGFPKFWKRIAKLGALPADVTPHVLRHSFASLAADLGYSEPTIGDLLGHRRHTTTAGYVHMSDPVLLAAADAIAGRTLALMAGAVVQLRVAGTAAP